MGPQKGQAGNLQKQFHEANVKKKKKLKHQLKHVMEALHEQDCLALSGFVRPASRSNE